MLREDYTKKVNSLRSDLKEIDKMILDFKKEDPKRLQMQDVRKTILDDIQVLRTSYIDLNKPCDPNSKVLIVLNSGRKVVGEAIHFGILQDGNVHITSYKQGNNTKYIDAPTQSVKIL